MMLLEQLLLFRLPPVVAQLKTRHVQLGARVVPYRLHQGRRRLSLTIDERGLRIGAPRQMPLAEIETFVRAHGEWVLRKLDEHAARSAPRHLAVRDGTCFPLLDGEARIRVVAGANRALWNGANELVLQARPAADLEPLARRGLQRKALEHFRGRVEHYARLMERSAPPLALTSARTRWGSCSRSSGLRLNWRLIHLPARLGDYVVAHEMAHLIEMNHSPRFWTEVERLYPEWRAARADLKRRAVEIPLIA